MTKRCCLFFNPAQLSPDQSVQSIDITKAHHSITRIQKIERASLCRSTSAAGWIRQSVPWLCVCSVSRKEEADDEPPTALYNKTINVTRTLLNFAVTERERGQNSFPRQ